MSETDGFVVRIRGLPFYTTKDAVKNFFTNVNIKSNLDGIHICMPPKGNPSGEAFVEVASEQDYIKALEKHNNYMGRRYIEVFKSTKKEMNLGLQRSGDRQNNSGNDVSVSHRDLSVDHCKKDTMPKVEDNAFVVRVRGLPFQVSKEKIKNFFMNVKIRNDIDGIHMAPSTDGKPSGEAYIELESEEDYIKALGKHKNNLGHRYIEVFKSNKKEVDWVFKTVNEKVSENPRKKLKVQKHIIRDEIAELKKAISRQEIDNFESMKEISFFGGRHSGGGFGGDNYGYDGPSARGDGGGFDSGYRVVSRYSPDTKPTIAHGGFGGDSYGYDGPNARGNGGGFDSSFRDVPEYGYGELGGDNYGYDGPSAQEYEGRFDRGYRDAPGYSFDNNPAFARGHSSDYGGGYHR